MRRPPRTFQRHVVVAGGLLFIAFLAAPAGAQQPALFPAAPTATPLPASAGAALRTTRAAPPDAVVLEGAIDPQTYVVGPGDVFSVSIGGVLPRQFSAPVSADGRLVIPEAGSFGAAGRTLAAVQAEVRAALRRAFANVSTDLTLAVPRQFYVHVSGAVPVPGRHVVRSVSRIEDALSAASGGTPARRLATYEVPARLDERRPALRNVLVTHGDGAEERVDLMRYFTSGDVRFNPSLRDGDVVLLPTFSPVSQGVPVNGAVPNPGVYDPRPDDTLLDVLIAAGWTPEEVGTALTSVRLTPAGHTEPLTYSLAEAARVAVGPRDQVYAVGTDPGAGFAEVVGAVHFAGVYPVERGRTTLAELVQMAGGLRADAFVRGAYLLRPTPSDPTAAVDTVVRAPVMLGDLDYLSRRFLEQELARTPAVAVDLARAMRGEIDVRLQDGDRLVVPLDLEAVRVFGQVLQPGYVPFVPGAPASAYVRAAGGAGPAATETFIVEARSGQLVADTGRPVESGDAVFVGRRPTADSPETAQIRFQELQIEREERREEREERRDARQTRYQLIQTVVGVVGTVASLVIAITALNQAQNSGQ